MMDEEIEKIMKRWNLLKKKEERLLVVAGGPGTGKSQMLRRLEIRNGWKYVEAKSLLPEAIFAVRRQDRPEWAEEHIAQLVAHYGGPVTIIDNVGILFAPIYNINPIEILRNISRTHPLLVGWTGEFDGTALHLEHNGEKDFFRCEVKDKDHIFCL